MKSTRRQCLRVVGVFELSRLDFVTMRPRRIAIKLGNARPALIELLPLARRQAAT